jgi:hypothetical protein
VTRRTRSKGVVGEREVAKVWRDHGLEVRGLEASGDHLVMAAPYPIHSEVKRQERLRLPEWLAQAAKEAPAGTIPVVSFRQNRGEWFAALRLEDLAELVAR